MFGKKHYVVYVPRQGGRKPLCKVIAKNVDDLKNTVLKYLEENASDLDIQKCKYVVCVDNNGNEVKIKNPYHVVSEKENPGKEDVTGEVWKMMYQGLVTSLVTTLPELLTSLFAFNVDLFKKLLEKMGDNLVDRIIPKKDEKSWSDEVANVTSFISAILQLAREKDKVMSLGRDIGEMFKNLEVKNVGEGSGPVVEG